MQDSAAGTSTGVQRFDYSRSFRLTTVGVAAVALVLAAPFMAGEALGDGVIAIRILAAVTAISICVGGLSALVATRYTTRSIVVGSRSVVYRAR